MSKTNTAADDDIALEKSLLFSGFGAADNTVINEENMKQARVPIIDLSNPNHEEISKQLWNAATTVGFFILVGHDVSSTLIHDVFKISQEFFAIESVDDKKSCAPFDPQNNVGYEYFSQLRPSTGTYDQKESFQITARAGIMEHRWPNPDFEEKTKLLLSASHALACRILDYIQPYVLPSNHDRQFLSKSHTLWRHDGQCTLRLLHYPPIGDETVTRQLIENGYWRAGAHTDWNNITLLYQRLGENGLECCANPRRNTNGTTGSNNKPLSWIPVDPIENGICVNIGDMLARWSDHQVYSNLHRVRLPLDATKSRYLIAFFAQSDKSTIIQSQTSSETITAGDYIQSRISSNFSK